jgi:hypothetical protein
MTREEALALYHPIRASVRRILSAAIPVCNQSDFMRTAEQLGLWSGGTIALPEGDQAAEMLSDIALFEPNQRGRLAESSQDFTLVWNASTSIPVSVAARITSSSRSESLAIFSRSPSPPS